MNVAVQTSPYLRENLPQYGNVPALVASVVLLAVSYVVGERFENLIANGTVVGDEAASSTTRATKDKRGAYELVAIEMDPQTRSQARHATSDDDVQVDDDGDDEYKDAAGGSSFKI